jgi:hypothetical protein
VRALDNEGRDKLLTWVPVLEGTVGMAQQETETLVAGERFSQISPTGLSNKNRSGSEDAS